MNKHSYTYRPVFNLHVCTFTPTTWLVQCNDNYTTPQLGSSRQGGQTNGSVIPHPARGLIFLKSHECNGHGQQYNYMVSVMRSYGGGKAGDTCVM